MQYKKRYKTYYTHNNAYFNYPVKSSIENIFVNSTVKGNSSFITLDKDYNHIYCIFSSTNNNLELMNISTNCTSKIIVDSVGGSGGIIASTRVWSLSDCKKGNYIYYSCPSSYWNYLLIIGV